MRRLAGLAGIVLLGSCSAGRSALPRMSPQGGLGAQAYAEAQARPRDAGANGRLGMVFEAAGQARAAEVCYLRAHRLYPKSSRWAYYLGHVESILGENQDAAASLREDSDYLPARLKLVEVLLRLGQLDESQETAKAILSEHPQFSVAYYWLGRVEAAKGLPRLAAEQYRKACQLWPSYGTAHHELAAVLKQIGNAAEAHRHVAAYDKFKTTADPPIDDPLLDAVRAIDDAAWRIG